MSQTYFNETSAYTSRKKKNHIPLCVIRSDKLESWLKKQSKALQAAAAQNGFAKEEALLLPHHDKDGQIKAIYVRLGKEISLYDMASVASRLNADFSKDFIQSTTFEIQDLKGKDLELAHIGWGLACYEYAAQKSSPKSFPSLVWAKDCDKKAVSSMVESINALRDLVNAPANILGPEELEGAARTLAAAHEAKIKVIKGAELIKKNFPLIHTVGMASPREPRLIEITHGNTKHPKLTLVGKGVVFDTGGLDLKPSQYMRLMKKDMGGAAHVLALAKLIMDAKLPVRLKVLIPAVENAVGGDAFRPGDIIKSRKGLFIENTNTDAEGRLILADALCYACEDDPELVIDYATLTGSARAGLGPDIPAFFCNNEDIHETIRKTAKEQEDPIWPMPLYQPYRKHIDKSVGDMINSTGIPGDGIYSALFLETFIKSGVEWMHLDVFSWESTGKAGRPVGAADTGLRSIFAYLQQRFG